MTDALLLSRTHMHVHWAPLLKMRIAAQGVVQKTTAFMMEFIYKRPVQCYRKPRSF